VEYLYDTMKFEYSEKEQELINFLGFSDIAPHIAQSSLYRIMIEDCFLKEKTGSAVESLRRVAKAFYENKVYRMTPEFDSMISL